jgi:uncharacterized integral membrane protein
MNASAEYIPGTCNIGPKEIKARRNAAIFSAILSVLLIILLLALHVAKLWRLTLFIPATSLGVGFLQLYNHFCVNFGLRGVFNFGDIGKTFSVDQKENFKKDRAKAWRMISTGIVFGLILSILFYILP